MHKNFLHAERLLENGEYREALKVLEALSPPKDLATNERLFFSLLESRIRTKVGDLDKAKEIVKAALPLAREEENSLLVINFLIVEAEVSWCSGRLDDGIKAVKEGEALLEELAQKPGKVEESQIQQRKGELLHQRGILYWYKGDLGKALESHQQSLTIKETLSNRRGMADSFNNLGLVYWSKGEFNQALKYYQQSLAINKELGNKSAIARTLTNLGNLYARKGNLDQALECQKQSLVIKEELANQPDIASSLINLGVIYQLQGDLNKAQEYYQRSLELSEKLEIKHSIALAINNLANIYELKGDLDQALQHYERSLAIYSESGMKDETALVLGNMGEVYRKKGMFNEALECNQQSLAIYEMLGNDPLTAILLSELVWVALEREDSTSAQKYLQKLQQIKERTDNQVINQRYRVAQALSLKASKRTRHKLKAIEILEQVANEEISDHSVTVTAMIHLCDLLFTELKMTGEEELLVEIKDLTQRLLEIAQQQSSHALLAETYLLRSKLALIELNLGQAQKLLTKAYQIAKEKDLQMLAQTVIHERDVLQSQMQQWESIIKENPSQRDLIDLTGIDGFLEQMIQTTVTSLIEEKGILEKEVRKRKYKLVYLDLLKDSAKTERANFRVGIAQIGLSTTGDLLHEFYQEQAPGIFGLRANKVKSVRKTITALVKKASSQGIHLLIFPELTIDLSNSQLYDDLVALAKKHNMYVIPGSYHDSKTRQNLSTVISPEGILWQQTKHIPATIHFEKKRITEGIDPGPAPYTTIVGNTEFGRIVIAICRDFLDMDLRVELKNCEPPIDLIINPAFTPVTADFKAAHFDARRSIYAYCFFANVAEFGDSLIYTPEKERAEYTIPPKEKNLIYKDIDLFTLRSERKKWELEQAKIRPFIQSTR